MANKYEHFSRQDTARKELRHRVHKRNKDKLACIRKHRFELEDQAKARAETYELKYYKCQNCNGYHLAKKQKQKVYQC